ncbi:hypothetical protein GCM10020229_45760 [Kitasatospora albolonga]|uniref:hypothetical protein n=1 Tax=Kitasatospora albolonga TaxID=68173 RepID=UPI0031E77AFA
MKDANALALSVIREALPDGTRVAISMPDDWPAAKALVLCRRVGGPVTSVRHGLDRPMFTVSAFAASHAEASSLAHAAQSALYDAARRGHRGVSAFRSVSGPAWLTGAPAGSERYSFTAVVSVH